MRRLWILALELAAYYVVYKVMTYDGPPIRQAFWFRISQRCQYFALVFGRAGLHAENRYNLLVNPPKSKFEGSDEWLK